MNPMHMHKSELALLQVFDAIYREGSITRAARVLNLTQPAVSHALARLRQRLQDPLFTRAGHKMIPSARARHMAAQVASALSTLQAVCRSADHFDPGTAIMEWRIGMRDVLEARILPDLLYLLRRHAPGCRLTSIRLDRGRMQDLLATDQLDLVIDVVQDVGEGICQQALPDEALVVVAGPGFSSLPWHLDAYVGAGHILVSGRRQGPGLEDQALTRIGRERNIVLRCQHYYAACQVVAATDLLLTMPQQYAEVLNRYGPNRLLTLPFPMSAMHMAMYWHERRSTDAGLTWLRQQLWSQIPGGSMQPPLIGNPQ